ncbi:MAG TPA: response regulator [Candidatus Absconditabacterales bacterium]|nr:response regulator [Candidatus Absconditabacterales bacterium]
MTLVQTPSILHSKKILVVDAKEDNALLSKKNLENLGVDKENITIVKDGLEALEAAKKQLFDVIITEIQLPGMDGAQLSETVRTIYQEKSPKMVVYTANQFVEEIPKINKSFDTIILKPSSRANFEEKLLEVFAMDNDKI